MLVERLLVVRLRQDSKLAQLATVARRSPGSVDLLVLLHHGTSLVPSVIQDLVDLRHGQEEVVVVGLTETTHMAVVAAAAATDNNSLQVAMEVEVVAELHHGSNKASSSKADTVAVGMVVVGTDTVLRATIRAVRAVTGVWQVLLLACLLQLHGSSKDTGLGRLLLHPRMQHLLRQLTMRPLHLLRELELVAEVTLGRKQFAT